MNKAKIKHITIADKIYFKKEDVEDRDHLLSLFTYDNADEFLSTIEESDTHYSVPSNAYYKLEWETIEDNRNFKVLDYQLEFRGELRYEQQEAVDKFLTKGRARSGLLQAPPGFGKCKPLDSLVLTTQGLLSLEELRYKKLQVYSVNGLTDIVDFYDNGPKECFAIKTFLGNIITGTANHPILLWDENTQIEYFKPIKDIIVGDNIIGMYNTNVFGTTEIEDPYLIGILLGDGSLTINNRIGFASADVELQNYFTNKFPESRLVEKNNHKEYYYNDKETYKKYVADYGIGCKSIHKKVDKTLRSLTKEQTILLLRGLFDTDGCANLNGTVEFCSSSENLAYYVFTQLLNLGIFCRIIRKKTKCEDTYIITITSSYFCSMFYNTIGFFIKRKQDRKALIPTIGALTSGSIKNLHLLFYKEYETLYKNKGLSAYFRKTSQISIKRVRDIIKAINQKSLPESKIITSFENKYSSKVINITSIGICNTGDIEVKDDSHCYISEGVVNHNTFTACSLIASNNTRTLILVHTKLLFEQWLKELAIQLPEATIGKIGDGSFSIGDVTVAIYKTAHNNLDKLRDEFSMLITDECHRCPADMFSTVVNNINAKVKIGLSATPRRKDGKHIYLNDFFSTHLVIAKDSRNLAIPSVTIVKTDFKFTIIDPKRDWARAVNKLCADDSYLNLIAAKAISYIKQGRCPLIIGDRVDMLKKLQKLIPASICVIGESPSETREDALQGLGTTYKAILTTKLFDEGISCHRLDTLFFTCPSNNDVTWEQRIGRIERVHPDKQFPLIVDFWLAGAVVSRQQVGRLAWYKQRGYNIL
jgi:superfamily II DNA or RNA helicase